MLGFYATADPSKPIRMDLDNELEGIHFRYGTSFIVDTPLPFFSQMPSGILAKKFWPPLMLLNRELIPLPRRNHSSGCLQPLQSLVC